MQLQAQASLLLPEQNERVQLTARLSLRDQMLSIEEAQALVRLPDGVLQEIPLTPTGSQVSGTWIASQPGLNYVEIRVSGRREENFPVDRSASLVIETQPESASTKRSLALLVVIPAQVSS